MRESRTLRYRKFIPWALGLALLALSAMLISRIPSMRKEMRVQVVSQMQGFLDDRILTFEDQLITDLTLWINSANQKPGQARAIQDRLREEHRWFDSLYLWEFVINRTPKAGIPKEAGNLLFPRYQTTDNIDKVRANACEARARLMSQVSPKDDLATGQAYLKWCSREPLRVRMIVTTEAANRLHSAGSSAKALAALENLNISSSATIQELIDDGLSPFWIMTHRTQKAQILLRLGKTEEALALYYETAIQITDLDAADSEPLLQTISWPILSELRKHGRDTKAQHISQRLETSHRRVRALQEVNQRILEAPPSGKRTGDTSRFIYDQYQAYPFLLFYTTSHSTRTGGAIQLDQKRLVKAFLATTKRYTQYLVVTDTSGNWVAGAKDTSGVEFSMPFSQTLSHLRVGMHKAAIDPNLKGLSDQWYLFLFVTFMCIALGFGALIAQVRANRQQVLLLARQKEFTTRVTHELKTPLAGIRLMGENLQTGAYKDNTQRGDMANRIVDEADRLTARVTEILTFSDRKVLPQKKIFDPEESILDAINQWGPRLEQAEIRLKADLHPTEELFGHADGFRDAVGCLLDNALKYASPKAEDATVWLTLTQEGKEVRVTVTDNGLGVPVERRRDIFHRFVRIEGAHRGRSGGYGLGLAQVAAFVKRHKGTISCEDGVNGGATFCLQLPIPD